MIHQDNCWHLCSQCHYLNSYKFILKQCSEICNVNTTKKEVIFIKQNMIKQPTEHVYHAGHYDQNFTTPAGDVNLRIKKTTANTVVRLNIYKISYFSPLSIRMNIPRAAKGMTL